MIQKIIRSLYYILFFVVPLVVIPTTSELFELNKMLVIYIVSASIAALTIYDRMLHRKKPFVRTPLDLPWAVFLIVMFFSTMFSIDRHTSFYGYYGRFNGGLLSLLAYATLYYGAAWYLTRDHVLKLLRVSVVTSFLVLMWGMAARYGYDVSCLVFTGRLNNSCWTDQFRPAERMFATLGQPNWLGAYLAGSFFIGLYFYLEYKKTRDHEWWGNIPYGIYLVLTFLAVLFTRSRSAIVSWGVSVAVVVALLAYYRDRAHVKKLAAIGMAVVLGVLIFKTGVAGFDKYITLPTRTKSPAVAPLVTQSGQPLSSEVTESFDIRKIVWEGAIRLGARYPVLGTGPETFAYSYYQVRPAAHNMTSEWDYIYNKAHNEYLNALATTGYVGLAAYVFLLGAIAYLYITSIHHAKNTTDRVLYMAALGSFTAIVVSNFFGFSTSTVQLLLYIMPALVVSYRANVHEKEPVRRSQYGYWHYVGFGVVGVFYLFSIIWIGQFFQADLYYSSAMNHMQAGDYQAASTELIHALQAHYEHTYEDRLSSALANTALLATYSDSTSSAARLISSSRITIDRAIAASPHNPFYWKTKGKNEYVYYQTDPQPSYLEDAVASMKHAYALAPTDPKLPYTLGLLYGALDSRQTALDYIDQAISLKKDYQDAYILKLKLLRTWKQTEAADVLERQILLLFPGNTREGLEKELQ